MCIYVCVCVCVWNTVFKGWLDILHMHNLIFDIQDIKYLQKSLESHLTLSACHTENIETSVAIISESPIVANQGKST